MIHEKQKVFKKSTHIYQDSLIKYQTQYSFELDKSKITVINRRDGKESYYILKDSMMIPDPSIAMIVPPKENLDNITIKEYRDVKKNIFGYECFKVVITEKKNYMDAIDPFKMFSNSEEISQNHQETLRYRTIKEIYVTEQIKCLYHPIIKSSNILKKYYPLEIIEKESSIEGSAIRYTLKKIELN